MLRITREDGEAGGVLRVEGRLLGPWVDELRAACDRHPTPVLDLRGLQTADDEGLLLLRLLEGEGKTLLHLSGYLAALLAAPP